MKRNQEIAALINSLTVAVYMIDTAKCPGSANLWLNEKFKAVISLAAYGIKLPGLSTALLLKDSQQRLANEYCASQRKSQPAYLTMSNDPYKL